MEKNDISPPDRDAGGWPRDEFSADLGHGPRATDAGTSGPSRTLDDHEQMPDVAGPLSEDERQRLAILQPGTRLEQGGVYVDLNDIAAGPFKALGGEFAPSETRLVSKKDVDDEFSNDLAGRDSTPDVERPGQARHEPPA